MIASVALSYVDCTPHNVYARCHSPFYMRVYDRMTRRVALKGKCLDREEGTGVDETGWKELSGGDWVE